MDQRVRRMPCHAASMLRVCSAPNSQWETELDILPELLLMRWVLSYPPLSLTSLRLAYAGSLRPGRD
jgi:hypothetical protein